MEHKDTEQKYDLYTEKIVLSPKVKYKNLIRTIKILVLIIIAGVVYIAADKLIVPSVKAKFDKKKAEQDRIEFTRDEYPEPVVVEDEEGQPQIKKDYDTLMQSLRTKVDDVQKSVVIIQESTEGLNYENYIENRENVTSTAGLIVAYVNSRSADLQSTMSIILIATLLYRSFTPYLICIWLPRIGIWNTFAAKMLCCLWRL